MINYKFNYIDAFLGFSLGMAFMHLVHVFAV